MSLLYDTWMYFVEHGAEVWQYILQQLYLVAIPVCVAIIVAIPVTILATRVKHLYPLIMGFSNGVQTIPSMALLVLMITIGLGIGMLPAVIALFVYALMPIVRNTYVGIKGVPEEVKDAAIGMGTTKWQLLVMVELPLAIKVIIAGVRSALVSTIGFATLAALIGAGGLGALILQGLGMADNAIVLAGTIPAVVMAFLAEFIMGRLEHWLTPRGLRD
ncbi:choline ABC transporter permease [Alicyclobacillus cellulosilyticus]|uniref:Choline ABC transporter permease n=1 Tax=Alicyclobacillus cellulosilyticus TaxID=1003997 RepID=A0A917K9Q2_9BACL|nr:ABC transporter permease [Alicyclobacillus cellulosilyticus]GGJ03588.1 choline ABC transporter permease [Alicyclobacillus cellulosilyticus]